MAQPTSIQSLSFGHRNSNCGNMKDCFNTIVYTYDQDAEILRWFCPLELNSRCRSAGRFGGIRDWLLGTSEFREWRGGEGGSDGAVFFCYGGPGVGKTYLW